MGTDGHHPQGAVGGQQSKGDEGDGGTDRPPLEEARGEGPEHHAGGHHHQDIRVQPVLHRVLLRSSFRAADDGVPPGGRTAVCPVPPTASGPTGGVRVPGDQPTAIPTMGLARGIDPADPWKGALPKAKMPPSEATR